MKVIAQNKKAKHDYFLLDKYEAGIELKGTEIKSIRLGNVNLKDSFVKIKDNEVQKKFVCNLHSYVRSRRDFGCGPQEQEGKKGRKEERKS